MSTTMSTAQQDHTPEHLRQMMHATCTIKQAMAIVQVSRRTIYNWMELGKLQIVRTAGGSPRIVKNSLFTSAQRTER